MESISEATRKQYSRFWKEWNNFCKRKDYNVFTPEIRQTVNWLTEKYHNGASYTTINTARSALSLLCGDRIGKDPTIARLMKGIFNKRPSKPKYEKIYDLDPVLSKLEEAYPLDKLTLSELTEKLVVLLALVTAHRKQTLHAIRVSNIIQTKEGYEIKIDSKIKTTRPGAFQPLLMLPRFESKPQLCVVRTLEKYLTITKELRADCEALFITTKKPFRKASRDTISRWLRSFLTKCGIGEEFTPHSLRHAATSAASRKGVDIKIIKSLAGWTDKSTTFDRFYNRPIINKKSTFAKAILS